MLCTTEDSLVKVKSSAINIILESSLTMCSSSKTTLVDSVLEPMTSLSVSLEQMYSTRPEFPLTESNKRAVGYHQDESSIKTLETCHAAGSL